MLLLRYRTRKIVFRTLFVLYFFVAAALLLFANGYRVRVNPLTISRTGNILATYTPKRAVITIDNQTIDTTSPARIRALFPGIHTITIAADGYLPYARSVRIEPQVTSFVSEIFLLRDTMPRIIGETTSTPVIDSPIPVTSIAGRAIAIETTPATGTRVLVNGSPITRDLGIGTWVIAGGDDKVFAIARTDTASIQLRPWNNPESVITTLPGTSVTYHEFNGVQTLLTQGTFELWSFNTEKQTAGLIYRFSKPIYDIITVPETTTVLVRLADEIVAFHLGDQHYLPTKISGDEAQPIVDARLLNTGNAITFTRQADERFITYFREVY